MTQDLCRVGQAALAPKSTYPYTQQLRDREAPTAGHGTSVAVATEIC